MADQNPVSKQKNLLKDILDFGPETVQASPSPTDFNDRIRQIVKKLQEINRRMDNLASKL